MMRKSPIDNIFGKGTNLSSHKSIDQDKVLLIHLIPGRVQSKDDNLI